MAYDVPTPVKAQSLRHGRPGRSGPGFKVSECQASSFEFSTLVAHQNHQVEEKVKVVLKRVLLRGWSMGPGVGSSGQAVACGLEETVALEVSAKLESVGMKELEEWEAVAELGRDVGIGGASPGDE